MPYWMKHADHGEMPVYDLGEVERHKKLGWEFVNQGEAPIRPPKGETAQVESDPGEQASGDTAAAPAKRGRKPKA